MSELPPFYQEQVKANIDVSSLDSARATVAELTEAAKICASPQPTASPRPAHTRFETKPHPDQKAERQSSQPSAPATGPAEPSC